MKLEINPYNEAECISIVQERYLDKIQKKFGNSTLIFYDKIFSKDISTREDIENLYKSRGAVPTPRCLHSIKLYSCTLYYYINYVLDDNSRRVADIGCGENFFKDIVPGIYGVEPEGSYADSNESFGIDGEYSRKHYQEFDSAISINAIHFISLLDFKTQVHSFANIIKPNGRGLLVMNAVRMVEQTSDEDLVSLFGTVYPTASQVEEYIDQEIKKIDLEFLVVDNIVSQAYDEWMDGNIRLVFKV